MRDRFHFLLGFWEWALFPFAVLFLGILGFTATRAVPMQASLSIIAVTFPLGYWFVGLYRVGGQKGDRELAQAYLDLASGARIGSYVVLIAYFLFALILTLAYGQFVTGSAFLFVSLGSIWMPSSYSSVARAKLLALGIDAARFFKSVGDPSYGNEKLTTIFLVLMLGKGFLLQRMFPALLYLSFLITIYLKGWIILSEAGAYPATLVGLMAPVLFLSRVRFSFMRLTRPEKDLLSNMLSTKIPSTQLAGEKVAIAFLSVLAILTIFFVLRV